MLWGIVVVSILPHFHPCPLVVLVVVLLLPCNNRPCIRHLVPAYSIIVDCCVVSLINQRHSTFHCSSLQTVASALRRLSSAAIATIAINRGPLWSSRSSVGSSRLSATERNGVSDVLVGRIACPLLAWMTRVGRRTEEEVRSSREREKKSALVNGRAYPPVFLLSKEGRGIRST